MTFERVLELLREAIHSEEGLVEEFLRRKDYWRAAQAQSRLRALDAFRETLLTRRRFEEPGR